MEILLWSRSMADGASTITALGFRTWNSSSCRFQSSPYSL
uniref:Uncharacterized protein n=1 Tax=Rhizophora mucronata TaxID=61149 RepID=A0A2P2PHX9_RHIMU